MDWVVRLFRPEVGSGARGVLSKIRASLLGWLLGRMFSMAVVGILAAAALYLIWVPGALFLGVFSGLVAFVPIIGSVVGAWRSPATLGMPWGCS